MTARRERHASYRAKREAWFWARVTKGQGCWTFRGGRTHGGYGVFHFCGRLTRAHRLAYELVVGPIPDDLVLDHLCRNAVCVNPAHLEPVTSGENTRRGLISRGKLTQRAGQARVGRTRARASSLHASPGTRAQA